MTTPTLVRGANLSVGGQRSSPVTMVMFSLKPSEREWLYTIFGPAWILADAHTRHADPDVVVVRPCSPQTIDGLRRRFPDAVLAAVELEATEPGLSRMPVARMLEAGLDRYATHFRQLGDLWRGAAI